VTEQEESQNIDSFKQTNQIYDPYGWSFAKPETSKLQPKPFIPTFQFDWNSFPKRSKKDPHPPSFESQFEEFNEYDLEKEEDEQIQLISSGNYYQKEQ